MILIMDFIEKVADEKEYESVHKIVLHGFVNNTSQMI